MLLIGSTSHAATIRAFVSPTAVIVHAEGKDRLHTVDGTPVLYCGLEAFLGWSARLIGALIEPGAEEGPVVHADGKKVALSGLLAGEGWLRPRSLNDQAQEALAERRGGWACSPKTEPFAQMGQRIDPKVTAGIAMNESGYRGRPWPWTLNVAGRGMYFSTRGEAHATIQSLLAQGRSDFDVGLMQVNWRYHGHRFRSPWEALSPATNIRVAEDILAENFRRSGSASKAVAWYHNANPERGMPYFHRFMKHVAQFQ
ncbi:transglycosylase SLT domain-containing protein [Cupriavidus sp. AU9028]|uniref:transglycosylase SLT domain-containing protein n=1 Tax=Cupriavidus sp. AU9028 TaxID=2871157 RepID=UPI001C977242|nr:transglycosylase SLT domain-containing protein [Cupriavidus sp. AU9028]MBY4898647.1 transglycosylase SLT domain-containing protein [Cupriavidus sp. AU9028]